MDLLDARTKILGAALVVLTTSLLPVGAWSSYALLLAFLILVAVLGRLSWRTVLRRSAVILPFVCVAVPVLVSRPGLPLCHVPLLACNVTRPGLVLFLTLLARGTVCVLGVVLLASLTPFPALLNGLRALRVPVVLLAVTAFMYRYFWILADEARRMQRAVASRSGLGPTGRRPPARWRATVVGSVVGVLCMRAIARSERVYEAMLARGFDGRPRCFGTAPVGLRDRVAGLVLLGVLGGAVWLA